MKRSWTEAQAKVEDEGCCRVCGSTFMVDPAHIIPRSRVRTGGEDWRNIVPLCRAHHAAYDQGNFDLLPHLDRPEQAYAVQLVGIHEAYQRITNTRVPEVAA